MSNSNIPAMASFARAMPGGQLSPDGNSYNMQGAEMTVEKFKNFCSPQVIIMEIDGDKPAEETSVEVAQVTPEQLKDFFQVSALELIGNEAKSGTEQGRRLKSALDRGKVPMDIHMQLMGMAVIGALKAGKRGLVLDGPPTPMPNGNYLAIKMRK